MVIRVSDKKKNYSKVTKLLVKPKLFSKKIVIGALINVQGRKFQLIYIEEDQEYVSCLMNI